MTRASSLAGYHSPQVDVDVRLNTNESPYPPPPGFVEALAEEVRRIQWHRYPDRDAVALREAVASFYEVGAESVFCANGSNEVIQCVLLAIGGADRHVALFDPTYQLHTHIADITGMPVRTYRRDPDFTLDMSEVEHACREQPALVFACSPNNPTGTVEEPDDLHRLVARAPGLVLVDEAYGEFATTTLLARAATEESLAVSRTFSKVWSLASLRLGFLVGPPSLVEDLRAVALPYHLSAFTQAAGLAALRFPDEMRERIAIITAERERLFAALAAKDNVEVWPSGANFLLFRPRHGDGAALWRRLLDRSVLVRDFSSRPLLEGCLRVSVGTPEENDRFLEALDASL